MSISWFLLKTFSSEILFSACIEKQGYLKFRWLDLLYKTVGKCTCQTPFVFDFLFYFKMSVKSPLLYKKEDRFY